MPMSRKEFRGGRGVLVHEREVLGTLMARAPKPEEFEFVKFRVEGEVAALRSIGPTRTC